MLLLNIRLTSASVWAADPLWLITVPIISGIKLYIFSYLNKVLYYTAFLLWVLMPPHSVIGKGCWSLCVTLPYNNHSIYPRVRQVNSTLTPPLKAIPSLLILKAFSCLHHSMAIGGQTLGESFIFKTFFPSLHKLSFGNKWPHFLPYC